MKTMRFSDQDFKRFKKYVLKYVEVFGLVEWNLTVSHGQIGGNIVAQTQYNSVSKNASIRLTEQAEADYGVEDDVRRLALHEVLHLLVADFCETAAKLGDTHHELVVGAEHQLIARLMRGWGTW
ncbi:MAG: hypothetical protein ACO23K_02180 [Ilumatobacteraceae bacterium]